MTLLVAGCASKSPPPAPPQSQTWAPSQPPRGQALPPTALTGDQMAKLSQDASDTYRRIQMGQPLILADVKVLAKLGFSADVIIAQVRNSRAVFHLTANDIIGLKDAGVRDQVIDFLMSTPYSIVGPAPIPEPPNAGVAQTPPPAPPPETAPPAPGADYVWIGGDWVWNGGWVWVGGRWALPPYPGAVWLHGRWGRGWGGYRRYRGGWR